MKTKLDKKFPSLTNRGERILAEREFISNNTFETGLNNNDLIIGPTGSGKTRYYVKPNILNASESLIVTDTKGNLCKEMEPALIDADYEVLKLDLTNPGESIGYNPFDYIKYDEANDEYDEMDISALAENLYGASATHKDPYWDESAKALLRSIISCVLETTIENDHNTYSVRKLFELIKAEGKDGDPSPYKILMDKLRKKNPDSYAAAQYEYAISENVEGTANCIRMVAGNKLAQYLAKEIDELMRRNNRIDILQLAKKKTALFVTISDMDRSQDTLANLFYSQALQTLCRCADKDCKDNCLPVPVRFILDDFATNACIPDFDKKISVIRSRGIAVSIILQSQTQLMSMYGEAAATTIMNGCDTVLYLGGQDINTANYIGTRTNKSDYTILTMPMSHVWLIQRGCEPKFVKRYELTNHPRYSLIAEDRPSRSTKSKETKRKER